MADAPSGSTPDWTSGRIPERSGDRSGPWSQSVVLKALWRARYVIVTAAVIAGAYGYVVTSLQDKTYQATAQLVLSVDSNFSPTGASSFSDSSRFVSNQVSIMTSDTVLASAATALGDGTTAADLASVADVSASDSDDVISIKTTAASGAAAAARADAIANAYTAYNDAYVKAAATAAQASTTDTATINSIKVAAAAYGDGVSVIEKAAVPTAPSAPQPLRVALLLAVATALVAGLVSLLWRGRAAGDTRIAEAAGGQLLGTVPVGPAPRAGHVEAPDAADHALALVALDYALDVCPSAVLVTGVSRASGSASVVLGLAAAASAGRRVVVVEADVVGGDLLVRTGAPVPARPLNALAAAPDEGDQVALREVVAPAPAVVGGAGEDAGYDVAVLAPGVDAGSTLGASALAELRSAYDLVLISAGPIATDPLAFALLRDVDGVIAVVSTGEDPALVTDVRAQLALAHHPLTGVVAGVRVRGARRRAWGRATPRAAAVARREDAAAVPDAAESPAEREKASTSS